MKILVLAAVAIQCAQAALHLRGQPPVTSEPEQVTHHYYMIQYVGLQDSGILIPRSPLSQKSLQCLTVGPADYAGGRGLGWYTCQDANVIAVINDTEKRESQQFNFTIDGKVRSKTTGLCLRRTNCKGQVLYDLDDCSLPLTSVFVVRKPRARNINSAVDAGYMVQAVAHDLCLMCGPYMLVDKCGATGSGCVTDYKAANGWTKLPSSYVGDLAVKGYGSMTSSQVDVLGYRQALERQGLVLQMGGLAKAVGDGICGSYVSEGPALWSIFYLQRVGM